MCGIAGLARAGGIAPGDADVVRRMTVAQQHRGPAAQGVHALRAAVLGHRRLSIIDTSVIANQPMPNEDGSLWLTYNGEIYNHLELRRELQAHGHTFRSASDTEVIVHGYEQWGVEGLLARLQGMYAFALHDTTLDKTVLVRDRLGIKPLYYWQSADGDLLLFASEVRALLAGGIVDRQADPLALAGFLLTGSVPAPSTVIRQVQCLMPAHVLVVERGRSNTVRYWSLPQRAGTSTSVGPDAGSALRRRLEDTVGAHLMSDVPLGVFLSGGVDSGAIVALAAGRNAGTQLTTLTVVFDEDEFSERAQARAIAKRFDTDHREIRVTHQQFLDDLPAVVAAMDQPTVDGVNTYVVSRAAREAGLTVVLSGLGGDEVFWGYPQYRWLQGAAGWLSRCPAPLRTGLARAATAYGQLRGREKWMRMAYLGRSARPQDMYLLLRGFFPPQQVARLLDLTTREVADAVEAHFAGRTDAPGSSESAAYNRLEFGRYLHDQLLRDADVFSMAHSIEIRVPFLDHRLVEAVAAADESTLLQHGVNKPLLVHAVDDPLVTAAASAVKMGFSFPFDRWMRGAAGPLEEMALSSSVLDRRQVSAFWQAFRDGRLHWSRAWALSVMGATGH